MVFNGSFFVAVRCAICSKLEIHGISLFKLPKGRLHKVLCLCGDTEFHIKTDDYKTFYFTVNCIACDSKHVFSYTLKQLFAEEGSIGKCGLTGAEILLIGKRDWIEDYTNEANRELDHIMEELGFDNYFHNPDIMIEALDKVHKIAEQKNLYCDCGSKTIDMNLFPDRIELRCMKCNGMSVVYAENREDLKNLVHASSIILREKSFACIDAINYNGGVQNK